MASLLSSKSKGSSFLVWNTLCRRKFSVDLRVVKRVKKSRLICFFFIIHFTSEFTPCFNSMRVFFWFLLIFFSAACVCVHLLYNSISLQMVMFKYIGIYFIILILSTITTLGLGPNEGSRSRFHHWTANIPRGSFSVCFVLFAFFILKYVAIVKFILYIFKLNITVLHFYSFLVQ